MPLTILGIFFMAMGTVFFDAISRLKNSPGEVIILLIMSVAASFGGIYFMLKGFREFMLKDILEELKKIAQNTEK